MRAIEERDAERDAVGDDRFVACNAPVSGRGLLEVHHVSFAYADDSPFVLNDMSLSVKRGKCVCLMGINGCGKSTLIDCVLGEHPVREGRIVVGGQPVASMPAKDRAMWMSYVPQIHERTFPYTVEHLVSMGLTAKMGSFSQGVSSEKDIIAVREAIESCGISHLADRPCTLLSGGEMQMVLLARALVQNAPLMLMDEPTAHLDFRNEVVFLETVERLVKENGVTVLMATHSPNQAFHLQSAGVDVEVALMKGGKIEAYGDPCDVLTSDALCCVFGVEGVVAEVVTDEGLMMQIVPLRSC